MYYDYESAETAKKFLDQKDSKADNNNMLKTKIGMLKKE